MIVMAPISVGELLDKISILTIKVSKITDADKKENVAKELIQLKAICNELNLPSTVWVEFKQLMIVNSDLWDIEDKKRQHEKEKLFDEAFIQLARNVYLKNDERASIKKIINIKVGSDIIEEKSY